MFGLAARGAPARAAALTQMRQASLKKTKQRIAASKNIEKITTAMKNVASARMKSAEAEAIASAKFYVGLDTYFSVVPKDTFRAEEGTHVILPVTSDRGLCGAVNSNVVRMINAQIKQDVAKGSKDTLSFSIIGSKGKDQLLRTQGSSISVCYDEVTKKPHNFTQVCGMADDILSREFDTMSIYYTKFINAGVQEPSRMDLFSPTKVEALAESLDEYECEPEKNEIMQAMYEFYFASNLYYCLSTSIASEMASRMVAMTGASTNAKDMITKLQILFNRTRQAIITGQLIEIVSASEAIAD
jgi:ATP synthase F1 gamma subunit